MPRSGTARPTPHYSNFLFLATDILPMQAIASYFSAGAISPPKLRSPIILPPVRSRHKNQKREPLPI
ncbi:MAG: hypothetical protein GDA48_07520 [Hormoscilla sp. GM102CHS1]|nr:hypothetical protein [Hormoscilla sp. GM102CHS1]